ncbi:hypothetical protein M9H77_26346 [Catharanthus roseus]|uniref:Uncharacterized protein n=1 Tax=Catharanthus roseus TaxID=4058 RepID=A0ACC0A9F7_CATRO|nr:hypothetical protein M9H77_26346 [Catharanthus roseus]
MTTSLGTPSSSEPNILSNLQNRSLPTQYNTVKHNRTNYFLWKTIIMLIIRDYKLDGYILGTKLCPPEHLPRTTSGSTVKIPNHEYEEWLSNDQLLLGWIYSTMSSEIASQLIRKSTLKELWDVAKELSCAHTRARVVYFKAELQKERKGECRWRNMKMEEYLTTMKAIVDNLTLAGNPIPISELVVQIMCGLDTEYTPIVTLLTDKELVSWIELQTNLLTYESRLEQLNAYKTEGVYANQATAYFTMSNTNNRPFSFNSSRGQNRSNYSNNGRGELDCNFMGSSSNQNPNVLMATPETIEDPSWYADTRANHHVINNPQNMQHKQDYNGKTSLIVANDSKLGISHIHNTKLATKWKDLSLNYVLCLSKVTKNLLSISRLVTDNKVNTLFNSLIVL